MTRRLRPATGLKITIVVLLLACLALAKLRVDTVGSILQKLQKRSSAQAHDDPKEPAEEIMVTDQSRTIDRGGPDDDAAEIFQKQTALENQIDLFTEQLATHMTNRQLSQLRTLRRIYSTGQFLRHLRRWANRPAHRNEIVEEVRSELRRLDQRWRELEKSIAALGAQSAAHTQQPD